MPYKVSTIARLNLPLDQKMVLILDLHYSHKAPAVLALLRANNIIPVFIPGGCTDLHQLCDVILNKSFKNGTKNAFVNYLSDQFIIWAETPNRDIVNDVFTINLALSVMKPLIPTFVGKGIAALKENHMVDAIRETFQDRCLLRIARLQETYALATAALPAGDVDLMEIPEEVEAEDDLGPVAATHQANDGNDEEVVAGQTFYVELDGIEGLSEDSGSDDESSVDSSSEDSDDDVIVAIESNKRMRKPSAMVGSVKKSKYSKL